MPKRKPAIVDPDAEVTVVAPAPIVLTAEQEREIIGLFAIEKPMAAIHVYIEITGADLAAARDAVLAIAEGKPVPDGWTPTELTLPPMTPEMQVVFPPEEGWESGKVVHLPKPSRPALSVAPAEPPKPPKPKVTKKEESRRFPLTDAEIEDRHALLCTETLADAAQELADKQIRAEITERRKARKARLQELAGEINNRATTRLVTVIYTTDYVAGTITEVVEGSGEVLAVKPLSGPEAQVPLFGSGTAAAPPADAPVPGAEADESPGEDTDPDDVN